LLQSGRAAMELMESIQPQQLIDTSFIQLANELPAALSDQQLLHALGPEEQCYLAAKGWPQALQGACTARTMGSLQYWEGMKLTTSSVASCWREEIAPDSCAPVFRPHNTSRQVRPGAFWKSRYMSLSRAFRVRNGGPALSSFANRIAGLRTAFVGDSTARDLANAFHCYLAFSPGLKVNLTVPLFVDTTERGMAGVEGLVKEWVNSGGGVIIGSIGVHYDGNPARPRTPRKGGEQPSYLEDMKRLTLALAAFAAAPQGVALIVSPPLQHFKTQDGTWQPTLQKKTARPDTYPCQPVTVEGLEESSPNRWRGELARMLTTQQQGAAGASVLYVPLNMVSQGWWQAKVGWFLPVKGPNKNHLTPDCTHLCYSPFAVEPFLLALEIALCFRLNLNKGVPTRCGANVEATTKSGIAAS